MKKLSIVIASLLVMTLSGNVMAQNTATETSNASATIISPLTLTKTTDLLFGTIIPMSASGTVEIPAATGSNAAYTTVKTIAGNSTSASAFTLRGEEGTAYTITLPADGAIQLTKGTGAGAKTMNLKAFTASIPITGSSLIAAEQTLYVGATLEVEANQERGLYESEYSVTVDYN